MDSPGDQGKRAVDRASYVLSRRGSRLNRNRDAWLLSTGFNLSIAIGSVIFDALRAAGQLTVDRDDLKGVVSDLGKRIRQLPTLTAEQRRLAEPALYGQIVERCTTLGKSASR